MSYVVHIKAKVQTIRSRRLAIGFILKKCFCLRDVQHGCTLSNIVLDIILINLLNLTLLSFKRIFNIALSR